MRRIITLAFAGLLLAVSPAAAGETAVLTFVAEPANAKNKEAPHSAAHIRWPDGKTEWLGFMPPAAAGAGGLVDTSDRREWVGSFVSFDVDADKLRAARKAAVEKYRTATYRLLVCDCVSFTADLGREVGLDVPARPNLFPDTLVTNLAKKNGDRKPRLVTAIGAGTRLPWR